MTITLETPRLILRVPTEDDLDGWAAFDADERATTFFGGPKNRGQSCSLFASNAGMWVLRRCGLFAVFEPASGEWVGRVGPWKPEGVFARHGRCAATVEKRRRRPLDRAVYWRYIHPMTHPPEGFTPHDRASPVTDPWAPLYSARGPGQVRIGFHLEAQHCNARGMLHGGVIAALADNAMGLSLGVVLGEKAKIAGVSGIVTTSLSVDYLGAARMGQWIEIAPRVVKASSGSGVVDALITADGETIARANASFRILK
jgi:uncharacterized protein (TIGR00369 family)